MNIIVAAVVIAVIATIGFIILLVSEQRDKERREKQGLPPKKYHDITDYDIYTVYTIKHK